ncbi:glycoside hydrolase family 88 protein [Niallia sp. FSL W8-0635]|uniref:glycoside hydrolase family 88 protein n=1 Tax=Niallia sp. FSL W8-0635 TaxID=2975337 RepID=UPI0030FCE2B3
MVELELQRIKEKLIESGNLLTKKEIEKELDWICQKLKTNLERYQDKFPSAEATNGKYRLKNNDDWTNGFWTGMLWMAYEYTQDETFKKAALDQVKSFERRLKENVVLEHHDLGFLYSLSVGAGYRITKNEEFIPILKGAADKLLERYQSKGGFLQAWGSLNNEEEYRLIIDSLINLPLLFDVWRLTSDGKYYEKAENHYHQVLNHIFREDYSTYHTYYFNPVNGEPLRGATHQGYRDDSCWARGQAWAVLGLPLNNYYAPSLRNEIVYQKAVNYFLSNLPKDIVPYWDFAFTKEDGQIRDSSALAIVACGLLSAKKVNLYPNADKLAAGMVKALSKSYTSKDEEETEGLLLHGVYAYQEGKGVDEPNLWGDYFYMEALFRLLRPTWETYW